MNAKTFEPFPPTSKDDWMKQVIQDIRGKDFVTTLTSMIPDGIQIQPYYAQEDCVPGLAGYRNAFHVNPDIPGMSPRLWTNVGTFNVLDEKAANQEILDSLMNGIDGLHLKVNGVVDWEILLKDVGIPFIKVYLDTTANPVELWESFKSWVQAAQIQFAELRGGILWDGFAGSLRSSIEKEKIYAQAASLVQSAQEYPNFRPLATLFSHYHQAGATPVQELAYGFASLVELIEGVAKYGVSPRDLFTSCLLGVESGADFFVEIAKIKSVRVMFDQLAVLYGLPNRPEEIEIFAATSHWTKSTWEVNTNLLRNTSEAMSAIFGGCNALAIGTHDFSDIEFSKRMARNISNILKEESFLDKVIDPAAGSYFLESLQREILEKTKSKLLEIENIGGWWKAFESTRLQDEIRSSREQAMQAVLVGHSSKIGVNKYALPLDRPKVTLPQEASWQLLPWRESLLFEYQNQDKS